MADLPLVPLEDLRVESFAPHVGSGFDLAVGGARRCFELKEAKALGAPRPGGVRAPFGLTFRSPAPRLPQAIYRLEHPALGALEIFLVPVGRDGDDVLYEAIFT